MEEIAGLLDVFRPAEEGLKEPPKIIAQNLRSDAAGPVLNRLLGVLHAGASQDHDGAGWCGFEGWTPVQNDAVASVAGMVVPTILPVPAELAEPVLVGIVAKSLEVWVSFLEKSEFDGENFISQIGPGFNFQH